MGRHIGPVCRLCRREGLKLFLKGTRCDTPKCAVDRREGVPGMHQFRRSKASEYSIRLREKQKVKRYYGIFERQFRKYFELASRRPGNTGDALMLLPRFSEADGLELIYNVRYGVMAMIPAALVLAFVASYRQRLLVPLIVLVLFAQGAQMIVSENVMA